MFKDAEDVKLKNQFDPTSSLYSYLDNLDTLKSAADPYHLRLCYPELVSTNIFPCNEWSQTKSPLATTSLTGIQFTAVNLTFDSDGSDNGLFQGLASNRVGKNGYSLLDATPLSITKWFSVGSLQASASGKVWGPTGIMVSKVELYMRRSIRTTGLK